MGREENRAMYIGHLRRIKISIENRHPILRAKFVRLAFFAMNVFRDTAVTNVVRVAVDSRAVLVENIKSNRLTAPALSASLHAKSTAGRNTT